eukprot:PhM_4_TR16345/c0_g1_i3/m.24762/K07937/ARF1; ADP-ribosylation factor 1
MSTFTLCGDNRNAQLACDPKQKSFGITTLSDIEPSAVACGPDVTYIVDNIGRVLAPDAAHGAALKPVARLHNIHATAIAISVTDVVLIDPVGTVHVLPRIPLPGSVLRTRRLRLPSACTAVACGALFSCCLVETGELYAFGSNAHGALGIHMDDLTVTVDLPTKVPLPCEAQSTVTKLACGSGHGVVVLADGSVAVWGRNDRGQLGLGEGTPSHVTSPVLVPGLGNVVDAACGDYHTLLLLADGSVVVAGCGRFGQLGLGPDADVAFSFRPVSSLPRVRHIAAGGGYSNAHSVAITDDGVYVWGSNSRGQLGLPVDGANGDMHKTPVPNPDIPIVDENCVAACGWLHTAVYKPVPLCLKAAEFGALRGLGTLQIPLDTLALACSYIATPRDLSRLAAVSAPFYDAASDDELWRPIYERGFPYLYQDVLRRRGRTTRNAPWKSLVVDVLRSRFCGFGNVCHSQQQQSASADMSSIVSRFFRGLVGKKAETRVLMLGLDAAGKTSILYKLKLGEIITTIPTIGFNVETVEYKNIKFTCWDVGGPDRIRPIFRQNLYYQNVGVVIFVFDCSDGERFELAEKHFREIVHDDELRDACVLVFANKQDLPNAMTPKEVATRLGIEELRDRTWFVQGCVATEGRGLYKGLDWVLANGTQRV